MCVYYCIIVLVFCCFFFFKQNTAYEMRISDWSSDVCSSDLVATRRVKAFIQNGLVESPSEDMYLTTNYTILPTFFETNPDGDVEWDKASVEATKPGYELVE